MSATPDEFRAAIVAAILSEHRCDAVYLDRVAVTEIVRGKTLWDGDVFVLGLIGHARAARCYAWMDPASGGEVRVVAILHENHIDSPRNAIRDWLVREFKRRALETMNPPAPDIG